MSETKHLHSKVAVVILNWNGKNFLQKFLPSVVKNSTSAETIIYVADNASTDDSVAFLRLAYPAIEIIQLDKNYGFAEGYNRALRNVNAEYFVLLNSDVEVTPNWLNPIIQFMDKNPQIGACQPKIKSFHQKQYFEYAGAGGGYIDKYGYPFCRGRILKAIEQDNNQYNDIKEIFWATGACMFVRATVYNECQGLDADFFAHMEEIDLCWRMQNRGYSIFYFGETEIYHVGGGTLPNNNPRKLFLNYRNNLLLLYKNLPSNQLLKTLFLRMVLDGVSALIYLFSFQFSFFATVFKAHIAFYKLLPVFKEKRKILVTYNENKQLKTILNSSIVFKYFVNKIRVYSKLNFTN